MTSDPSGGSSRRSWLLLLGLFVAGLVARVLTFLPFPEPGYPDAYYYMAVARELVAGHGFTIGYIWNFVDVGGNLPAHPVLPIPSNAHWMPLASIVQVPFIWVLGPTLLASVLPFWLLGALAVPMTYLLGLDAGLSRRVSLAAAALMTLPGSAAPYLSQPDNFSLYMVLGVAAMWLCTRGLRGDRRAFALGGVAVGLATLARTDGVLLGVPFALAFAIERWRLWLEAGRRGASRLRTVVVGSALDRPASRAPTVDRVPLGSGAQGADPAATAAVQPAPSGIGWTAALSCIGLFLLTMAPWWARDLSLFGSISPSSSGGRILWIPTYTDLFRIGDHPSPATFFAQGWGPLLASRIGGLVEAVVVIGSTPLLFFLVPFVVIGAWRRAAQPAVWPWAVYGVTFLVFSGLVFAVHLPYGMALHSEMALVPMAYLLAALGIGIAVDWVARRRPHWQPARATRNFTAVAIGVAWLFAGIASLQLAGSWSNEFQLRQALLRQRPIPVSDRLMSADPGAFWYRWGIVGVPYTDDSLAIEEQVARAYDVRWLILERAHILPALAPVLRGTEHPSWLSAPLAEVPADHPGAIPTPSDPLAGLPKGALYAVCLTPGDRRCSGGRTSATGGPSGGEAP